MTTQTDRLGTAPIGKLFITMSLPIIMGMLVNGLYNIVDAIFVTRGVGSLAIGGISIVFPVQMLIFAFAAVLGSGAASIVSRKLGAKKHDEARHTAQTALSFSIFFSVILAAIVLIAMKPILRLLGVTEALWLYSVDYLTPILFATPIAIIGTVFNDLLRAEGKMQFMMMTMLLGSILNIILDAVFIFGFGMGVTGAAVATVISQTCAMLLAFSFYFRGKTTLHLSLKDWKIDWKVLVGIIALGLPFFISHAGASFMIATANNALSSVGGDAADIYISAYGLVGRVIMFVILPLIGIMIAFQTIVGYNYGAQNFERVRKTVNMGLVASSVICISVSALMVFQPELFLSLFTSDPVLLAKSAEIARVIFLGFSLAGVTFMITGYFQATGHARMALFASSARVYIFLIPLVIILPKYLGIDGIWFAFPIADISACLLATAFFIRYYRKLLVRTS
ncbi:MATE family efflux transporter [Reinekea sp.]|jgi:putative MATE family efflux protein|uniref:MATE family efflux transporter n=1 Tax=Reinekea sp. TaxID=1970455 RepID=UPI003989DC82